MVSKNKRTEHVAQLEAVLGKPVTPTPLSLLPEPAAAKKRLRTKS
jgi:hypothetical protein